MKMKTISSIEEFYKIIEEDEFSLVYFYTNWCPDCFATKMYLPRLEGEYPTIRFYNIDRDQLIELAKHYNIFGIPSFLFFKNNELIGEFVSGTKKSYVEVKKFVDDLM